MTLKEKKYIRTLIRNLSKGILDWADFITLLEKLIK